MTGRSDIAVIGGGIAGASVAWHLSERTDLEIRLHERGELAGETTAKSAAFFGFYGHPVERRMKRYGMSVYDDLYADPRTDLEHHLLGRLRVATSADGAERIESPSRRADVRTLDGDEIDQHVLCPHLEDDAVEAAGYRPHVGYHDSRQLALEFLERARENGVIVETNATVEELLVSGGAVQGLRVDGDRVETDAVVACAGPWNPHLLATVDVDVPVYHSLAPVLELEPDAHMGAAVPIVKHAESGVYVRDAGEGRFIVAHHPPDPDPETRYDPSTVSDTVPSDHREQMWQFLETVLPTLAGASVVDERVAVRSHTPDGRPIVGWTEVEGLSVVAFDSSGIQLAPAAGRMVASQLLDGDETEHYDAASIARFDGHEDVRLTLD